MLSKVLIEVCCGSVDDAVEAERGGADRIELNSSLFLGGLTPSLGSIIEAKKRLNIPVMVMIRPRAGGFCYTQAEMAVMQHDAKLAVEHDVDGLVFGILSPDGSVDAERCKRIIELIRKLIIQAGDRIEILPGSGLRPHNIRAFVEQTKAAQVHFSAFVQRRDSSTQHRPHITFSGALRPADDRYNLIDRNIIQSVCDLLGR
jgi:copper homeostasis protein